MLTKTIEITKFGFDNILEIVETATEDIGKNPQNINIPAATIDWITYANQKFAGRATLTMGNVTVVRDETLDANPMQREIGMFLMEDTKLFDIIRANEIF